MARFSETLLEHARYPRNLGRDDHADRVGQADLGGGPPRIELFLRVKDGIIVKASFAAAGCGVTIGVCSALTELLVGRPINSASRISAADIIAAVEGVPFDKTHVVEVAVESLRDALCDGAFDRKSAQQMNAPSR